MIKIVKRKSLEIKIKHYLKNTRKKTIQFSKLLELSEEFELQKLKQGSAGKKISCFKHSLI